MLNTVELAGYYGGDETHACSAWTSTSRALTTEKSERIPALLKMLADNKHETPFEKSLLHFLVTADTASHIHIIKHRIGVSANVESARYKELRDDKFLVPQDWPEEMKAVLKTYCQQSFKLYHETVEHLVEVGFTRKRAKESARFFIPYASQVVMDVSFNFRSFIHFQRLRNDDHAQLEIRNIAVKMLDLVRDSTNGAFTHSLSAFGY